VFTTQIYLNGSECCRVFGDDRIGFYNERHEGPLGYEFTQAALVLHGNVEPELHARHDFDPLRFPYRFALAAAFDTGIKVRFFLK